MYRYQNVLICLNLSQVDPTVIRYAGLLTRVARSSRACFMHVVSKASLPDSFLTEYPQLAPAVDDMMRQRLVNEVDADFHGSDATERTFTILQGDKLSESLARIRDDGVDLVMLGRKREQSGHDSLEKQLTRKAPCSVLIVPEGSPPEITRVLCAVDFSEFSRRALDKALLYCRNLGLPALDAVHYYDLPTGYYKTGLSADEFAAKLEPHLHREFERGHRRGGGAADRTARGGSAESPGRRGAGPRGRSPGARVTRPERHGLDLHRHAARKADLDHRHPDAGGQGESRGRRADEAPARPAVAAVRAPRSAGGDGPRC
jgi:nucleotide-binding universal stress UspA family protein